MFLLFTFILQALASQLDAFIYTLLNQETGIELNKERFVIGNHPTLLKMEYTDHNYYIKLTDGDKYYLKIENGHLTTSTEKTPWILRKSQLRSEVLGTNQYQLENSSMCLSKIGLHEPTIASCDITLSDQLFFIVTEDDTVDEATAKKFFDNAIDSIVRVSEHKSGSSAGGSAAPGIAKANIAKAHVYALTVTEQTVTETKTVQLSTIPSPEDVEMEQSMEQKRKALADMDDILAKNDQIREKMLRKTPEKIKLEGKVDIALDKDVADRLIHESESKTKAATKSKKLGDESEDSSNDESEEESKSKQPTTSTASDSRAGNAKHDAKSKSKGPGEEDSDYSGAKKSKADDSSDSMPKKQKDYNGEKSPKDKTSGSRETPSKKESHDKERSPLEAKGPNSSKGSPDYSSEDSGKPSKRKTTDSPSSDSYSDSERPSKKSSYDEAGKPSKRSSYDEASKPSKRSSDESSKRPEGESSKSSKRPTGESSDEFDNTFKKQRHDNNESEKPFKRDSNKSSDKFYGHDDEFSSKLDRWSSVKAMNSTYAIPRPVNSFDSQSSDNSYDESSSRSTKNEKSPSYRKRKGDRDSYTFDPKKPKTGSLNDAEFFPAFYTDLKDHRLRDPISSNDPFDQMLKNIKGDFQQSNKQRPQEPIKDFPIDSRRREFPDDHHNEKPMDPRRRSFPDDHHNENPMDSRRREFPDDHHNENPMDPRRRSFPDDHHEANKRPTSVLSQSIIQSKISGIPAGSLDKLQISVPGFDNIKVNTEKKLTTVNTADLATAAGDFSNKNDGAFTQSQPMSPYAPRSNSQGSNGSRGSSGSESYGGSRGSSGSDSYGGSRGSSGSESSSGSRGSNGSNSPNSQLDANAFIEDARKAWKQMEANKRDAGNGASAPNISAGPAPMASPMAEKARVPVANPNQPLN